MTNPKRIFSRSNDLNGSGKEDDDPDADAVSETKKNKINEEKTEHLKTRENRKFICEKCGIDFSRKNNLKRHQKNCQNNDKNRNWKCTECDLYFYRSKEWKGHLAKAHNVHIQEMEIEFDTYAKFMEWKRNEENQNFCCFVKQNTMNGYKRFVCNRHGNPRKQINQKGERKNAKGLCHTGLICPAGMVVSYQDKSKVTVRYTPQHTTEHPSNKSNLAYVRMPKEVKEEIETYIQCGATPRKIINQLNDEHNFGRDKRGDKQQRIFKKDLITIKDIQNLVQKMQKCNALHPDDHQHYQKNIEIPNIRTVEQPKMAIRHKNGMTISDGNVRTIVDDSLWLISSEAEPTETYDVRFTEKYCDYSCTPNISKCAECGICRHNLECECEDYANGFLCKHCHKIQIFQNPLRLLQRTSNPFSELTVNLDRDNDFSADETDLLTNTQSFPATAMQNERLALIREIHKLCDDIKTLSEDPEISNDCLTCLQHDLKGIITEAMTVDEFEDANNF